MTVYLYIAMVGFVLHSISYLLSFYKTYNKWDWFREAVHTIGFGSLFYYLLTFHNDVYAFAAMVAELFHNIGVI